MASGLCGTDGPFIETKELVARFWLWQVKSMDEADDLGAELTNCGPMESACALRSKAWRTGHADASV
jgi:hypothetical protein